MKYILLFLVALMGNSLFNRDVFAQSKIFDSITFQLNDLPVTVTTTGGGAPTLTSQEIVNQPFIVVSDSESVSGDTLFIFERYYQNGKFGLKIKMTYDSTIKTIKSFAFLASQGGIFGASETSVQFFNTIFEDEARFFLLMFDSTQLKNNGFKYRYDSRGREDPHSSVVTVVAEEFNNTFFPTTSVRFSFYKHTPSNSVKPNLTSLTALSVFPSPVNSSLNIHLQNPDDNKLIITDLLGREVLTRQISEGEEDVSLNVASLLKGVYWVRVGSRVQKFIVQH